MWSLMFIENLLHAQSHICLPNKHIFSFYNRRNRLRKVKWPVQILKSGFIPSFTWFCFTVLSASFIGSKKKIGFWFHTWVISSRGIDKISLLHTFADFLDRRGLALPKEWELLCPWHSKAISYPRHIIWTSLTLQIFLLHFTAKENRPAIQIPSIWVLTLLQTLGCPSIKYWIDLLRLRLEKIKIRSPLKIYFISWDNDTKVNLSMPNLLWVLLTCRFICAQGGRDRARALLICS